MRSENDLLKLALAEATVQLRIWQKAPSTPIGSLPRPEALRAAAGLPVSRFAPLAGISRRSYQRRLVRLRDGEPVKGPWPTPAVDEVEAAAAKYAEAWAGVGAPQGRRADAR